MVHASPQLRARIRGRSSMTGGCQAPGEPVRAREMLTNGVLGNGSPFRP